MVMACSNLTRSLRELQVEGDRRERAFEQRLERLHGARDRQSVDALIDVQGFGQVRARNGRVTLTQDCAYLSRGGPADQELDQRIRVEERHRARRAVSA